MFSASPGITLDVYAGFCGLAGIFGAKNRRNGLDEPARRRYSSTYPLEPVRHTFLVQQVLGESISWLAEFQFLPRNILKIFWPKPRTS
jgi:hypothetical protein